MRLTAFIFFAFLNLVLNGQETYPYAKDFKSLVLGKYNYVYNEKNYQSFEEKIKILVAENNPDSSLKATKIMWGLSLYDTIHYSQEYFKPLLEKIIQSNTAYFEENLKGSWRFSHDFWTGLVSQITTTTDIDTGKVIRLDGRTAYFYFKDSLLRQTTYKIVVNNSDFEFRRVNYYSIHFDDKNENWSFSLGNNYYDAKTTMIIYPDPHCVCGCRQDIFKKITAGSVSIPPKEHTKIGLQKTWQAE